MFNFQIYETIKIYMIITRGLLINMSSIMLTCPVCGYTFRNESLRPKKKKIICPMCSFKFKDPNIRPEGLDEFFF